MSPERLHNTPNGLGKKTDPVAFFLPSEPKTCGAMHCIPQLVQCSIVTHSIKMNASTRFLAVAGRRAGAS
jgi:hypothetical protein